MWQTLPNKPPADPAHLGCSIDVLIYRSDKKCLVAHLHFESDQWYCMQGQYFDNPVPVNDVIKWEHIPDWKTYKNPDGTYNLPPKVNRYFSEDVQIILHDSEQIFTGYYDFLDKIWHIYRTFSSTPSIHKWHPLMADNH